MIFQAKDAHAQLVDGHVQKTIVDLLKSARMIHGDEANLILRVPEWLYHALIPIQNQMRLDGDIQHDAHRPVVLFGLPTELTPAPTFSIRAR